MEKRLSTDGVGRQIGLLLVGRSIAFAVMFFLPMLLARIFPRSIFGLYRQFFLIFYGLYMLLQLGASVSLPAMLARHPERRRALLSTMLIMLGVVGALCAVAGGLLQLLLSGLHPLFDLGLTLGIFTGLMIASTPLEPTLLAEHRSGEAARWIVAWDLARGGLLLAAAWWSRDLQTALGWMTLAAVFRWLAMGLLFRRRYQIHWRGYSPETLRLQLREAGPLSLQAMAHLLEINIDRYVVMFSVSAALFAVYTVGAFQLPLVDILFSSVCGVLLPLLAQQHQEGQHEALCRLYQQTVRRMLLVLVPLTLCLFVARRETILLLFSARYEQSIPIFSIYLFIIPTYATLSGLLLQAISHRAFLAWSSVAKAVGAVLFVTFGMAWWGLEGVVGALIAYHYLAAALLLWLSAWALRVPIARLFPARAAGTTFAIALLAWGLQAWLPVSWERLPLWVGLLLKPAFCLLVYLLLLWRSGALSEEDRSWVTYQWRRLTTRLTPGKSATYTKPKPRHDLCSGETPRA